MPTIMDYPSTLPSADIWQNILNKYAMRTIVYYPAKGQHMVEENQLVCNMPTIVDTLLLCTYLAEVYCSTVSTDITQKYAMANIADILSTQKSKYQQERDHLAGWQLSDVGGVQSWCLAINSATSGWWLGPTSTEPAKARAANQRGTR